MTASGPPDVFHPANMTGRGVRRLNRVPLLLVGGVIAVVGSVFGYTLYQREQSVHHQAEDAAARHQTGAPADPAAVLAGAPSDGMIPPKQAPRPALPPPTAPTMLSPSPQTATGTAWQRHAQQQEQIDSARLTALESALNVGSNLPRPPTPPVQAASVAAAIPVASPAPGLLGHHDAPNGQAAKAAFLTKQPLDSGDLCCQRPAKPRSRPMKSAPARSSPPP